MDVSGYGAIGALQRAERTMSERKSRVPAVGIGASAGGVEALERLFRHLPGDTGLAFVVVTHLAPDRQSLLPEIVRRFTEMEVHPVRDGLRLGPNCVYILPENALVTLEGGVLKMRRPDLQHRERKPVDLFLSALAIDLGECAAGVVLSGGDGDGTLGVKAIKQRGGLTLAQTGDGPAHPSMPQSAIATGLVDFAVSAEEMGDKLAQFARSLQVANGPDTERVVEPDDFQDARADIYRLLRNQIGHDFSGYKTRTFNRRVQRRMQVVGLDTIDGYVERLHQDPAEVSALFRDLLINVTNFFRDADAFKSLAELVIPKLFEGRGADDTVRVWVPGCATGEEVYSLAILMREHMDGLRGLPRVQIFATDIDDVALNAARGARYPEALMDTVSQERRRRFFTQDGASYVVAKEVRDLCIFSPHSVIRDPPFSRMDMVSCRNLLIYLGGEIQQQVIPTFRYALRPGGYLFLGSSENVSQHSDLFAPLDKAHRIFRAREDGRARIPLPLAINTPRSPSAPSAGPPRSASVPLRQSVEAHVLERIAPPHVVVNADGEAVYYSARTGKYLEAAAGTPSRAILSMARRGLRLELRSALREATEGGRTSVRESVPMDADDGRVQMVTLTVDPMDDRGGPEALFLITFADSGPVLSREDALMRAHSHPDGAVAHLEQELREARDRLQSMIEEYETALEELKSSNEELVSVNEELQSTNEELEASKEELQSLNEELQTVNGELSHKVDALDQSNGDLHNLFESTQIATVFLDRKLLIRNFTPPLSELFNIVPNDRGRPLTDFTSRLAYPGLDQDVAETLASRQGRELKVDSVDGRTHYLARLRPYTTLDGDTEGVIATFVDVTSVTEAEARQRVMIDELNHRVKNMLAVVIGVVRQAAKTAVSMPQFVDSLVSRIESMARAYELLSRENWTEARVDELARLELAPFGPERTRLDGPDVMLKPKPAMSLSMVLHELVANALEYGALSRATGRVDLAWSLAGDESSPCLALSWRESGGPPVVPAAARGFGLKLVERETSHGLDGKATLAWEPAGLQVNLSFPLS